jgi:hypothetical protein
VGVAVLSGPLASKDQPPALELVSTSCAIALDDVLSVIAWKLINNDAEMTAAFRTISGNVTGHKI